jgi:trimeric autotransporter adhesin
MMTKQFILALAMLLPSLHSFAQVAINTDNANPDASAMLDVKSTTKGVLVPRMTTPQRTNIATPATGLLVFDTNLNAFYFYNGAAWTQVGGAAAFIADADGNTSVHTEKNANEDVIRFKLGGTEQWRMVGKRFETDGVYPNTFIGFEAGVANTSVYNTFLGYQTGKANLNGNSNTFLGYSAGPVNTSGSNNVFVGNAVGLLNTTGSFNTFLGSTAGWNNLNGSSNCFFGREAGYFNESGEDNLFSGRQAGYFNTSGNNNTFSGSYAGHANTSGNNNCFMGNSTGLGNTTGRGNTAIGSLAGENNQTGDYNTFVGYGAGSTVGTAVTNSTAIGKDASVSTDNTVSIGNSSITSARVQVAWTITSDGRFKTNIQDNVKGIDFIRLLKPVTYKYNVEALAEFLKEDYHTDTITKKSYSIEPNAFTKASRAAKSQIIQTGFIAQEVEAAAKSVGYDFSGIDKPKTADGLYGLRYSEFTVPIVKAVQELDAENQALKRQLQEQATELKALKAQVEKLMQFMATQTASNKQ